MVLPVGFAHLQMFPELPFLGGTGEIPAIDNASACAVEGAFIRLGKLVEEFLGDDEVEHGVAEKLQALVIVLWSVAARMREGLLEQGWVFEGVLLCRVGR
jgi:hypothetical protein